MTASDQINIPQQKMFHWKYEDIHRQHFQVNCPILVANNLQLPYQMTLEASDIAFWELHHSPHAMQEK
jgi:hypothetical protein|eukprot:CAMPEP_0174351318 /NCGR_PEP_ID=MMETSP0811_2-20130205/8651_1 /TAXON_ID=73025 ORGANISM="Eutreptiella gymnastica-like, Strain CCMP1594" /NCGR_SAMPLE_ID=MMETSP0811_2 /ASSEMBLY_ACC=CAM_ASM_000667 /LENGTH=67 /DNA_ID=CAMNT_0015480419 /DNA_START=461 /DNA_END=664 /DNA_ORIENTATION=-